VSRSRYKPRSNRSAKILTTVFSLILIISFVLSLIGPQVFQGSSEPTPIPTRLFATSAPFNTSTPVATPTPTAGIPTPVVVTPTSSP
jgi:cytoskeletal protein RodZ